jgi:DNA-binding NtrC family response regulator
MDPMGKKVQQPRNIVVIMGTDAQDAASIRSIIEEDDYQTASCNSLNELKSILAEPCMAVIIDIDSVPLDNRTIRALTRSYPATCFLCTSKERFHPDLKDAISHYLFACLHKPVKPDELQYFLKCIHDNGTESRGPPQ